MHEKRPFRRPDGLSALTWVLLGLLGLLSVYPTVTLLSGAFRDGSPFTGNAGWSLEGFARAFASEESGETILNSLILALATAILGTGLGFVFAWLSARTTVTFAKALTPIMVALVALPSLFMALGWATLGNARAGVINNLWTTLTGSPDALMDIYSWPGLIAVMIIKPVALSYLLLLGPCKGLSRSIEEAAVLSGTRPVATLIRVTAPVLTPTILAVSVINLIIGLEAFDVPSLLAFPAGIPLLSTEVYRYVHDSIPSDYPAASALALAICVLILVLVAIRQRLVAKHSYATVTGKTGNSAKWKLGPVANFLFATLIVVFTLLAVALPLAQLVIGSFQPTFGVFRDLGFSNYESVLSNKDTIPSIVRSLLIGVGGGFLGMVFTLAVTYVVRHAGARWSARVLDIATWLPAALPGIVLGLALSWAFLLIPPLRTMYGSPVMLVTALMIAGMPLAARASEGALVQLHRELEEAARLSGATRLRTVVGIIVPLIAPSFLAGWLLTALYLAGRLDVPILMSTPNTRLSIVAVYEMYSNGRIGEAAAIFCLLLLGFVILAAVMALLAFAAKRFAAAGRRTPVNLPLPVEEKVDDTSTKWILSQKGSRNG